MNKKLCVFPTDPIIKYYEKGEIKSRYFNPKNFFDEIHIISFIDKDVEESKVQVLAGNAKLKIYSVGKVSSRNRKKELKKVLKLVGTINPQVIRTYNSLLPGWFAANCAQELKIPLFVSLHTQYDYLRNLTKKRNLKKYLGLKFSEKFIEPFVIKTANKITIVYGIIEPYVAKYSKIKPEVLPNRINCRQFSSGNVIKSLQKPLIISVGRLIEPKNHQCVINAIKEIDAYLLIIGDGHLNSELMKLIKLLKLENKVKIERSISNNKIQDYYKSAAVFALAYDTELEGLPIPVMEAMASGLPIVIPNTKETAFKLSDAICYTEKTPSSFAHSIKKILEDDKFREKLSKNASEKSKQFDSIIIEKREAEIYLELISNVNFQEKEPNS